MNILITHWYPSKVTVLIVTKYCLFTKNTFSMYRLCFDVIGILSHCKGVKRGALKSRVVKSKTALQHADLSD